MSGFRPICARLFFESFGEDFFEVGWKIRIEANRWRGHTIQNSVKDHAGSISAKRQNARSHLIQHHSERKQVSARVQLFGSNLFGRHVRDRAHWRPRAGEQFVCRGSRADRAANAFGHQTQLR
jgi:hypothetical protein